MTHRLVGPILSFAFFLLGCASATPPAASPRTFTDFRTLEWTTPQKRMILMQLGVDLRSGGQPRDEWNRKARTFATTELRGALASKRVELFIPPSADAYISPCPAELSAGSPWSEPCRQYVRDVHGAEYAVAFDANGDYPAPGDHAASLGAGRTAAGVLALGPCTVTALLTYGEAGLLCKPADRLFEDNGAKPSPWVTAKLMIVEMRTGSAVWQREIYEGDWRDERSARRTARLLLQELPL
jgi:hypothetical protein